MSFIYVLLKFFYKLCFKTQKGNNFIYMKLQSSSDKRMDDFEPFVYTNELIPEEITKETARVFVKLETRKYNKPTTVIQFSDPKGINIDEIAKKLKKKLACGGTAKDESVILQGDHRDKVVQYLVELGFKPENIVMQ